MISTTIGVIDSQGLTFGHKWIGLIETSLSLLALGYVTIIISNILGIIVLGMGKVGQRLKILIDMATLTLCLDVVLILKYGVIGVVATNSLMRINIYSNICFLRACT